MADDEKPNLSNGVPDYVALLSRVGLGFIPGAGPVLSEIVGSLIPQQRLDRVVKYLEKLACKLQHIDEQVLRQRIASPEGTDLLEDSFLQAVRAITDDRRERIATLTSTVFANENFDYAKSKVLMRLLGQISDDEILILRARLANNNFESKSDVEFVDTHRPLVFPRFKISFQPPDEAEQQAIFEAHVGHLVALNLLTEQFNDRVGPNDFMSTKVTGHHVSKLGKMLLQHLHMLPPWYLQRHAT